MKSSGLCQPIIPRDVTAARLRRGSCSSATSVSSSKTLKASNRDVTLAKKVMQFEEFLTESQLTIFNALWDVLSPCQRIVLSLLLQHSREDGNQILRHIYLGALQLELQLVPIQDPANVARFLAMLDELGANATAELIQRIHPIEVVMPQQNHEQDFDDALVHNVSSSSGSDTSTTDTDSSTDTDE